MRVHYRQPKRAFSAPVSDCSSAASARPLSSCSILCPRRLLRREDRWTAQVGGSRYLDPLWKRPLDTGSTTPPLGLPRSENASGQEFVSAYAAPDDMALAQHAFLSPGEQCPPIGCPGDLIDPFQPLHLLHSQARPDVVLAACFHGL